MKRILFLFVGLLMSTSAYSQQQPLGFFHNHGDVGSVEITGAASFNPKTQDYTVEGAGENMWFEEDSFHFMWRKMSGDFILRSEPEFTNLSGAEYRKMGWVVRSSLDPSAAYVSAAVHGNGLASLQFREEDGAATEEVRAALSDPDVVQLERRGDRYILSVAKRGDEFGDPAEHTIDLGDEVYVGLFVCSHDEGRLEEARFRNVRIVVPPGAGDTPYQDYLGSNLEIMDVETGRREIVYRSEESLQAPNWTPDGSALIYNSEGLLYRFDLEARRPEVIDSDFADRNNNDHVISFDGTRLGISHHPEEHDGQSIIYTMPLTGGTPTKVTEKGPSYLHGWSADDEYLTYTGLRDGEYDIYVIPTDGGEEIRLTDAPGLDDGSEYTPDGEYIYFNSERTGSMEIWRMRPDGSEQVQITDDHLNNWFPHISPDGRRIVFLSYLPDVPSGDHPYYKQVYLRMMPIGGGEPEVVGYLFGGQGTINVPSWSPDGRRIAFVSNTGLPVEK